MEDFSSQFHKHQKKLHAKPREGLLTPRQRCTSRLTGLFPLVVPGIARESEVLPGRNLRSPVQETRRITGPANNRKDRAGWREGRQKQRAYRNRCFQLRRWHCACEQRRILLLRCDNLASSVSFALGGPSHRQSRSSVPRDRRCFQLRCWRCACEKRRILLHCRDNLATSRVLSPARSKPSAGRIIGSSRSRLLLSVPRLMRFWTNFSKKFLWRGASSILSPACCTVISVDFPEAV